MSSFIHAIIFLLVWPTLPIALAFIFQIDSWLLRFILLAIFGPLASVISTVVTSIFDSAKFSKANRDEEDYSDYLYERVADEIESGNKSKGIWAKAISKSNGNLDAVESIYIQLRVKSLSEEGKDVVETPVKCDVDERGYSDELDENVGGLEGRVPEFYNEEFNLTKIKSAILRDDVDYVDLVVKLNNGMLSNSKDLVELAELSSSEKVKKRLLELD